MTNKGYADRSWAEIRSEEQSKLDEKVDGLEGKFPTVNIVVAGKTGVGKSTLINAVFEEDLAATGIGEPVTKENKEYTKENVPISIWDTVGLELDDKKNKDTNEKIMSIISEKNTNENLFDRVHCIWYCVSAMGVRFEEPEAKFVTDLYRLKVPFVIVMTKCIYEIGDDAFQAKIKKQLKEAGGEEIPIIQVLASDFPFNTGVVPRKGLKELVDFTVGSMPEFLKKSFVAAQRVDQECKRKAGAKVISKYVKAAKEGSIWRDIIGIRLWLTNSDAQKMLNQIAILYNIRILQPEHIDKICHDSIRAVEKGELKYFWKPKKEINNEFDRLLQQMEVNEEDFSFDELDRRAASLLALYGFKFMNAVETVWENATQKELNNINRVVELLTKEMNRRY